MQRSPAVVLRNAIFTTFILVLVAYPVLDRQLALGRVGAMNPILIYAILALGLWFVAGGSGAADRWRGPAKKTAA